MNNKQRIVLIMGAAALLYFLFTSPKISIVKGTYVTPSKDKEEIAKMIDVRTAMTRAVAVLGATILCSIAFKDKSPIKKELISSENCQPGDRKLVKDRIAKIINFLKNFF